MLVQLLHNRSTKSEIGIASTYSASLTAVNVAHHDGTGRSVNVATFRLQGTIPTDLTALSQLRSLILDANPSIVKLPNALKSLITLQYVIQVGTGSSVVPVSVYLLVLVVAATPRHSESES
jgi:hypothetical protein